MIAWATIVQLGSVNFSTGLFLTLVTIWGVQLWGYLIWRNWGKDEDRRYDSMRRKHGDSFWGVSLFTVFLLQGALMWFISLAFQSGMFNSSVDSPNWLTWAGVVLWTVGLFFESLGDYQESAAGQRL